MRVLLTVSYDGTDYCGWQRQKNGISVQQKLEEALSKLYTEQVEVRGSSRTDSGVHALGQGVLAVLKDNISCDKIPRAVNTFLPKTIRVVGAREVKESFHPQYSVIDKTYTYKIQNADYPNPLLYNYSCFEHVPLNEKLMREGASYLIGEHDFKAFCSADTSAKTTVRTIYSINITREGDIITITIKGSGFLYNMVRIIVGTLIEVGKGKYLPSYIGEILNSRDRRKAGKTVIPNGLTLMEVNYNE